MPKDISKEVNLLQVVLDALDGPNFLSGRAPNVIIMRDTVEPVAYYFVNVSCDAAFLIREIEQLRDTRLIAPMVRDRLIQAYRNTQEKIEQTIARLKGTDAG